jgi:DNA-binding GntR family transcriptional regulator
MPKSTTDWLNIDSLSLADRVYEALREAILSGRVPPDERLIEADLGARFGTSATPVREALRRLASGGLVSIKPYIGATLRSFTQRDVEEIYEIRELLEPQAVYQAAANLDAEALISLEAVLRRSEEALATGDNAELSKSNRLFHSMIIGYADNERMITILQSMADQLCMISPIVWAKTHRQELEGQQHSAILQALKSKNAQLAKDLTKQHIRDFRQTASDAFGNTLV